MKRSREEMPSTFSVPQSEWTPRVRLPSMMEQLKLFLLPPLIRIVDEYLESRIRYYAQVGHYHVTLQQDNQFLCRNDDIALSIDLMIRPRRLFTDHQYDVLIDSDCGLWRVTSNNLGLLFEKDECYIAESNDGTRDYICDAVFIMDNVIYCWQETECETLAIRLPLDHTIIWRGTPMIQHSNCLLFLGHESIPKVLTTHLPLDFMIHTAAIQYEYKPLIQVLVTTPHSKQKVLYQNDETQTLVPVETSEPIRSLCCLGSLHLFQLTISGRVLFRNECVMTECTFMIANGYSMVLGRKVDLKKFTMYKVEYSPFVHTIRSRFASITAECL